MDRTEPVVDFVVKCKAVNNEMTPVPDQFVIKLTPESMAYLETLIAFGEDARARFLKQFPAHRWSALELMYDGFDSVREEDPYDDPEDDESCDDDGFWQEPDLSIDIRCIRLLEDAFILTANLENGDTRIESDLITHEELRQKFEEVRAIELANSVSDAIENERSGAAGSAPRKSAGMSL